MKEILKYLRTYKLYTSYKHKYPYPKIGYHINCNNVGIMELFNKDAKFTPISCLFTFIRKSLYNKTHLNSMVLTNFLNMHTLQYRWNLHYMFRHFDMGWLYTVKLQCLSYLITDSVVDGKSGDQVPACLRLMDWQLSLSIFLYYGSIKHIYLFCNLKHCLN